MEITEKITKQLAYKKMKEHIEMIEDVCKNFSDPNELFLFTMYHLTAKSMWDIMGKIGDKMNNDALISGADSSKIIIECFENNLSEYKKMASQIERELGKEKPKSHNETLRDELLTKLGLTEDQI